MQNWGSLLNFFEFCPTEKSRYATYCKLSLWGWVISPLLGFVLTLFFSAMELGYIENTFAIIILDLFGFAFIVIHLFYLYTSFFLFVKLGILKYFLKLLFMWMLTFALSFLLTPAFALLSIVIALIAYRKRRKMLAKYHNYVKYLAYPLVGVYLFCYLGMILAFGAVLASSIRGGEAIAALLGIGGIVCIFIFFAWPVYGIYKLIKVEEGNGVPFATMYKLSWMVPLTYLLMIFSIVNLIPVHFFKADTLIADIDFGVDNGITDIPEYNEINTANDNYQIPDNGNTFMDNFDKVGMNSEINNNIETNSDDIVETNTLGNDNIGINSDSVIGATFSMNFDGTIINTPMHVEAFQENPYSFFALNQSDNGTAYDICSASGMPQIHITDNGEMLNSENVPIGRIEHGDDGISRMFAPNNIEVASINQQGFIKSDGYVLGQMHRSGGMDIFHDFKENKFYKTDMNGIILGPDDKPIGLIKNV